MSLIQILFRVNGKYLDNFQAYRADFTNLARVIGLESQHVRCFFKIGLEFGRNSKVVG